MLNKPPPRSLCENLNAQHCSVEGAVDRVQGLPGGSEVSRGVPLRGVAGPLYMLFPLSCFFFLPM